MAPTPRIVILDSFAFSYASILAALESADRLTEYDVIVFSPTRRGLTGDSSATSFQRLDPQAFQSWLSIVRQRSNELRQFLDRGGVLVVFLEPLGGLEVPREAAVFAAEVVLERPLLERMQWTAETGRSISVLDPDHPLARYLTNMGSWTTTIRQGVLARDPHGYPLALSRDEQIVAYAEHLGRGSVYWVPRPKTHDDWAELLKSLIQMWSDETDPLLGLAASEISDLDERRDTVQSQLSTELADLRKRRTDLLERRRRLVSEDRALERALQHYRAAQAAGPARALDFMHRMLEVIEHEYGSEQKTRQALAFSKATGDAITNPANHKPYRARHEGGEGLPVPAEVLQKAHKAAREILGKFLEHRIARQT